MKTAISVPDTLFARVDEKAAVLGVNRSEFYSIAAERYLRDLDADDLTARFDEAVGRTGTDQREALEFAERSQRSAARLVADDEW
ncbi:CopG family ribbon-helix-helix protein [Herbiconiux sp. YIM B11900]|uniref:CopG family ribbon-helix-helix protein n=1 Tax=Herbiconiux sp. YIM B11900 TaxID=3404131 RepID=UPI003F845ADC